MDSKSTADYNIPQSWIQAKMFEPALVSCAMVAVMVKSAHDVCLNHIWQQEHLWFIAHMILNWFEIGVCSETFHCCEDYFATSTFNYPALYRVETCVQEAEG